MFLLRAFILASIFASMPCFSEDIDKILKNLDQMYRSNSSEAVMKMTIKNENWQRSMEMKVWTKGMKKTLIYITAPNKDKGISTLRRDGNMWNFFPKINKVVKVPPSMMMGSWMGSDFTNDDLVKESTFMNDYFSRFIDGGSPENYYIELKPKPETVTIWDKIVLAVDKKSRLLKEQTHFDGRGNVVRKLSFSSVKTLGGKTIPSVMTLESLGRKKSTTVVEYTSAKFDHELNDNMFSLGYLKRYKK